MTIPSHLDPHRTNHRRPIGLLLGLLLAGVGVGCSTSEDRPTESAWKVEWEQRQQLIPDAEALLTGGREYCDQLDGEFRVALRELLPSPLEVLDDPVDAWILHAVSIVFECSDDESTLADQLETLEVLAAEVDGGLSVENG